MTGRTHKPMTEEEIEQKKREFLVRLLEIGTVCNAARAVGIHPRKIYHWKEKDSAFQAALEETELSVGDDLEACAINRAKESSDTLLIFLLKGHKPEKFRERGDLRVSGGDGGPLKWEFEVKDTTDADDTPDDSS